MVMADLSMMDDKELSEREEAGQAYSEEDESYYDEWVESCVDESQESNKDVRNIWDKCWDAYRTGLTTATRRNGNLRLLRMTPLLLARGRLP